MSKLRNSNSIFTEIHLLSMTWSMLGLSSGLVRRHFLIRLLHSSLTLVHSGLGNSYWPDLPSDQSEVSAAALDQSQLT